MRHIKMVYTNFKPRDVMAHLADHQRLADDRDAVVEVVCGESFDDGAHASYTASYTATFKPRPTPAPSDGPHSL